MALYKAHTDTCTAVLILQLTPCKTPHTKKQECAEEKVGGYSKKMT